jgi:hypothetical protein
LKLLELRFLGSQTAILFSVDVSLTVQGVTHSGKVIALAIASGGRDRGTTDGPCAPTNSISALTASFRALEQPSILHASGHHARELPWSFPNQQQPRGLGLWRRSCSRSAAAMRLAS